jgi:hypothetical protein
MKNLRLLIIALTLVTFFSACKKDDAPKIKTTAEKISSDGGKKWMITSMKAKFTFNGQQQEHDVFAVLRPDACLRDNLLVLFSDKKFEAREGATKCGSNDLLSTGTWELRNNDTELYVTSGSDVTYSTLKEVTETSITTEFPRELVYEIDNQQHEVDATITAIYTAQ